MHILDDATLIQQFISGEATLAANQNLRIEPAFDSIQFLSKRGGLIASLKRVGSRRTVLLRQQSEYSALIRQILLARHFMATPSSDQPGFAEYRADDIPEGYEVVHATAKELWKEWWRTARQSSTHSIHMELLIFARDTWYPIRNIVCSQGNLFITTLVSEVSILGSETHTWLRRLPAPQTTKTPPTTAPKLARSLQAFGKTAQPRKAAPERTNAITSANFLDKPEGLDSTLSNPELREVVRIRNGKLYVKTALGEVVVEGSNLKYRLEEGMRASELQKPLNLNGYREGRAVNQ